jgi:hypothetical protein
MTMANNSDKNEIRLRWIEFTNTTGAMLVSVTEDRPLDQFLEFRGKALALVQSEAFLDENAWGRVLRQSSPGIREAIREALLTELRAFALAAEVTHASAGTQVEKRSWLARLPVKLRLKPTSIGLSVADRCEAKLHW